MPSYFLHGLTIALTRTWALANSFKITLAKHDTCFLFSDTRWRGWRNKQLILAVQMLWKLLQRISQRSWWTCSVAMAIYTPLWLNIDSLIHSHMQEERDRDGEGWEGFFWPPAGVTTSCENHFKKSYGETDALLRCKIWTKAKV